MLCDPTVNFSQSSEEEISLNTDGWHPLRRQATLTFYRPFTALVVEEWYGPRKVNWVYACEEHTPYGWGRGGGRGSKVQRFKGSLYNRPTRGYGIHKVIYNTGGMAYIEIHTIS